MKTLRTWIVIAATGSASAQSLRSWHEGASAGEMAGFVTALDDLDGDGAAEYAIGAPNVVNANGYLGEVTVYDGRTDAVKFVIAGGKFATQFGTAISDVPDFDGDLVGDLAVGDRGHDQYGVDSGAMNVYSGATGAHLGGVGGGAANQRVGHAVAGVGDMDGDGKGEVAVTTVINDSVAIWQDGPTFPLLLWSWQGQPGGLFGHDVAPAGDVDGDGAADVIIGEPYFDVGPNKVDQEHGRALVYSGATGLLIWDLRGGSSQAHFGIAVDGLGDVDGDGLGDLLVGCHQDATNGSKAGKASVFSGATGALLYEVFGGAGELLGQAVASVGDLDGDGVGDFAVAAPRANSTGRISTHSGVDGSHFHDYDHAQGEYWGYLDGGDFDGDGDADLVIGTPAWVDQSEFRGRAEIWCTSNARWSNYGVGWAGTYGVPLLVAKDDPVIGEALDVFLGNSLGSFTFGLLFLGLDDASIVTKKGGTLLVDPFMTVLIAFTNSRGETLGDTVPDDPALCDLELFLQVLELDPGATGGLSFSEGLLLHFGHAY